MTLVVEENEGTIGARVGKRQEGVQGGLKLDGQELGRADVRGSD